MPPRKRTSGKDRSEPSKKVRKSKKSKNGKGDAAEFGADSESEQEEEVDEDNDDTDEDQVVNHGSSLSGEVLFTGGTNWDMIGRKQLPKGVKNVGGPNLWGPHRISSFSDKAVRSVISGCTACHSIIITTEGKTYSWGRNDKGQLGLGDTNRRDLPTEIELVSSFNIVDAACGRNHTLLLTDTGKVFSMGDNKMGQLGIGNQTPYVTSPTKIKHKGPPVRKVACGAEFSMIADIRGNLFSFGLPEYGQLGHNTDGKYFVSSNKMSFTCELRPRKVQVWIEKSRDGHVTPVTDVYVEDVACGVNHTVIMDSRKRVFTWGFGGYGRLGHAEPKDEMVPRLLKYFDGPNRGVKTIAAGSTFCMAISEMGALFLWGQTKSTGEAAMYPKPVQDLSGWEVRSIACCNKSIAVAADQSVVTWGSSPTYGELGYGDDKPKSSTIPQEMKTLAGIYVHRVSCGFAHTLMLARKDSDDDKEKLDKLPVFTP